MNKRNLSTKSINLLTLAFIFTVGMALIFTSAIQASTTIIVNSYLDEAKNDGTCTLREAVIAANKDSQSGKKKGECSAGNGADTIIVPAGTYILTKSDSGSEDSGSTGDLDITSNITIKGDGADQTIIRGEIGFQDRIFHILSGTVQISNLSLESGYVKEFGGAVYNAGSLVLENVSILNNGAQNGGGIYNSGELDLLNSTLANNQAGVGGGALFNAGNAEITNSTISGNTSGPGGSSSGGGLLNASGSLNLTNTTIVENNGNISISAGIVNSINTIFANTTDGFNCYGQFTSLGHNLSSDGSCSNSLMDPTDINNMDPMIGDLRDNGGDTWTHALMADSPAIDAGMDLEFPITDQRGISRPFGSAYDIGSYELTTAGNVSWMNAQEISPEDTPLNVYIDKPGLSRWYRFEVHPGQQVIVTLTDLPGNYDLTLYKDIGQAYIDLTNASELPKLDAEFAPDAFSPDAFSPDAFSPDAFSPDAFSPDAFSPDAFSPDAFSPDAFSPDAFSPDAFSPDAFSPDAFSSAQTRSLIGVSAFEGNASEGILVNTWDNTGYFYIRVRGRNGIAVQDSFAVMTLAKEIGLCEDVSNANLPDSSLLPIVPDAGSDFKTIILWDSTRVLDDNERLLDPIADQQEIDSLRTRLMQFAEIPSVNGVVVDVSSDVRVQAAKVQANNNIQCPYAVNLVAESIEDIIDGYWQSYPLEYVVLIGNDESVPFFREPDHAMLANEKNYVPPVRDATTSQASLKLGYVLSQDRYGSPYEISLKESDLPVPGLAVGRLVETISEITGMLDAYETTTNGVVDTPASTLVTGYDFLSDSSEAIASELYSGTGFQADTLISDRNLAPSESWTADDLKSLLLGDPDGHDLIYLAGHFSANSTLAADYITRLLTTDLLASNVDLENSIIFSAGCHSGYNIVDLHDVPGVTRAPDWAQAFAKKGATLIAGTGYQYGDTDFIEYSERLYLEFSRQLRVGSGPVSVGKALAEAKRIYLASTPQMRGIHEKAYLEATLFGLPMLSVDLPQGRITDTGEASSINQITPFSSNPGAYLGLEYADLSITPVLDLRTRTLTETTVVNNNVEINTYEATFYSGSDGVVVNPVEPIMPLESYNVSFPGFTARGVGFRGGSYVDNPEVIPLTGAATTEIRGVHTPFLTNIYFPVRFWGLNYFDTLASGNGVTRLNLTPAQFISDSSDLTKGTLRGYMDLDFRLYYSNNFTTYGEGSVPALSDSPSIANVTSAIVNDQINFQVTVLGNPAAGIQEVWITFTATSGSYYGQWQSLDLVQNPDDSRLWEGSLPLDSSSPQDIRFMVQAVNGVGMVSALTNLGLAYIPGVDPAMREPTSLTLLVNDTSAPYGTRQTFAAKLIQSGAQPLVGERVLFRLGPQTRLGITDQDGIATVEFPILGLPDDPFDPNDDYELKASFPGTALYESSTTFVNYNITKQNTILDLTPNPAIDSPTDESILVAKLTDSNTAPRLLAEKTVFFILTNQVTNQIYEEAVITDYAGRANLGSLTLEPGIYLVQAYFSGVVPLQDGSLPLNDDRYNPSTAEGMLTLNDPPTAVDDFGEPYTLLEDTILSISAPGILGNDFDPDGFSGSLSVAWFSDPSQGLLSVASDGSLAFTPPLNYSGEITFTYKASDGIQESNLATVTLEVTPVNDPPVAGDDVYTVYEDHVLTISAPGVLSNDTDIENSALSAAIITQPQHGVVILYPDGSFTYTPTANYYGMDLFTYAALDDEFEADTATVKITVLPLNDAPEAADDTYTLMEDTTLYISAPGVLNNDLDLDGDQISVILVSTTAHGTLTLYSDGSFSYTPVANFSGSDSFTYFASDGFLTSNLATVNLSVADANDPPFCGSAYSSVNNLWPPNGDFYQVYVLGVTDPENDTVTITITSIYQDELVGNAPDGIIHDGYAEVRAERDGNGDGRVYHITFIADDGKGGICTGEIKVAVIPHDKSGSYDAIDGGALYDSTIAD